MGMLFYIKIILAGIITSCYFFPFEFSFMPGLNTKMAMAGVSLILLTIQLVKGRNAKIDMTFFKLSSIAVLVSLICLTSVIINGTYDYTYATYVVSMWVWLGGAYVAVSTIRRVHGFVSVPLICNYLIGVCVAQCFLALLIDYSPQIRNVVNTLIFGFDFVAMDKLGYSERLYGIGAALDVAGTRFSTVLIIIVALTTNSHNSKLMALTPLYLLSFIIIAIVGNMIARTTTVGLVLAILYWLIVSKSSTSKRKVVIWLAALLICLIPYMINRYNTNYDFRSQINFAFEGFFSLAESGKWNVSSNNNLKNMIVFPESLKTWIIGDGYLENPRVTDPHYVGPSYRGYYMGTDIGYLRLVFYFGVPGLLMFMFFFYQSARICVERFKSYKLMFWFILILNFIIWIKVATDLFVVFALFLCISQQDNDDYEKLYEDSISDQLNV